MSPKTGRRAKRPKAHRRSGRALLALTLGSVACVGAASYGWSDDQATAAAAADPALMPVLAGAPPAPPMAAPASAAPRDPWRRFNRRAFGVNRVLDKVILGPIAHAYMKVTPAPVRRGVGRVLDNLREPSTVLNDLAQVKPTRAIKATARFAANTTVGVLGMFDVASKIGLDRHRSDFGQTLGRYGAKPGPYIYLPVVGPLNMRDGIGGLVNTLTDPVSLSTGGAAATARLAASGLDYRASGDETLKTLNQDSIDPYAATQSAYSQYRAAKVREVTGEVETLPDFDDPSAPAAPQAALPVLGAQTDILTLY